MRKLDGFAIDPEKRFFVIPAKVPRQARDPELVERAGIQSFQVVMNSLDSGDPVPAKAGNRSDGFLRS